MKRGSIVVFLVLAACSQLESEEAQAVAKATKDTAKRGVDLANEQIDRIDTERIRRGWNATVEAVEEAAKRRPAEPTAERADDPLADIAEAITCDEARERCTVTDDFATRARQHGGRVAAQVRVSPASGKTRGVRIDAIDPGTLADVVGLKVGDVVTHVNGTSLASTQDAMMLYMSVRAARRFVVHYRRGEEERSLQLDVV